MLFLISFILALRVVLVAKYLSIIYIFLNISFFSPSLSLLKTTGTGTNLSTYNLSTLLVKLLKLLGTFFNLSIFNSSKLDFKLTKTTFLAKDDTLTHVTFLKSAVVA